MAHGHDPELVQFLNGFADVGEAIVESGVSHITFIGSPEVGKKVQLNAARFLIPCLLELGGKDCAIVLKDADLNQATPVLMRGVFQNCGQNCIGIERIILAKEIYDKFVTDVEKRIKELRLGAVLDDPEGVDCGAMTMGTTVCKFLVKYPFIGIAIYYYPILAYFMNDASLSLRTTTLNPSFLMPSLKVLGFSLAVRATYTLATPLASTSPLLSSPMSPRICALHSMRLSPQSWS